MKWHHVQDNWPAFFEAILDRWPDADEADIIELTGQEPEEARADIREWLSGELPSDVVMDPRHDNHSIALSKKYVPEGEDEYDDDSRFGDEG